VREKEKYPWRSSCTSHVSEQPALDLIFSSHDSIRIDPIKRPFYYGDWWIVQQAQLHVVEPCVDAIIRAIMLSNWEVVIMHMAGGNKPSAGDSNSALPLQGWRDVRYCEMFIG